MTKCKNCGTEYADDVKFCGNCGAKLTKEEPKKSNPEQDNLFAKQSDEPVTKKPDSGFETQNTFSGQKAFSEQKSDVQSKINNVFKKSGIKINKTFITITAVVLAIIIVAVAVLPSSFGKSSDKKPEAMVYLKDGEINYTSLKAIAPVEITSDLNNTTSFGTGDSSIGLSSCITMSKDGYRLFYPDKTDSGSSGFTLYYKEIKGLNENTEAIKIDSDIVNYMINSSATKVIYVRSDGNFYESDLTSKNKIDTSVIGFFADNEAERIIYQKQDGVIYLKVKDKDKQKIDSESDIKYISDDINFLYYLKDKTLYKYDIAGGNDKVKIDTDVTQLSGVYKSGELYYTKTKSSKVKYMDYIDDDMKESDAALTKPVEPEIPEYSDYDTYEEYSEASDNYIEEYESYLKEKQEYLAKEERDEMRETLSEKEYETNTSALCYFDGKTTNVVSESVASIETANDNKPVCILKSSTTNEISKLKLSIISSVLMVEEHIQSTLSGDLQYYAAVKGKVFEIDSKEIYSITTNYSGSKIYYIDDINEEKGYGTLNEITVNDSSLGSVQKYDDDVNSMQFLENSDTFVYYKDIEKEHGDLMMNKKKIDSDVSKFGILQISGTEQFLYAVDYNSSEGVGTLKLYDGEKTVKIADDVHSFYAVNDKCITYMQDYDSTRGKGDLYLYDGSDKKKQIDTDVTDIIQIRF